MKQQRARRYRRAIPKRLRKPLSIREARTSLSAADKSAAYLDSSRFEVGMEEYA